MEENGQVNEQTAAEMIIDKVTDIPPAPPVAFKLLAMLRKKTQNNQEIVDVIRYDPDLTAQLLKMCNSAGYRGAEPIASLDQAVLRLGYQPIMEKVMSLNMRKQFTRTANDYGVNPYDLWRHSITSAISCKYISSLCDLSEVDRNICFTAGLLHDIGKALLNSASIPELSEINRLVTEEQMPYSHAERQVLGTDHADVGATLLHRWNLTEEVVNGVRHHNDPENDPTIFLGSLLHVSSLAALISRSTNTAEEFLEYVSPHAMETLGMDQEAVEMVLKHIQKESGSIEAFMMIA